jgi:hypothetical protein
MKTTAVVSFVCAVGLLLVWRWGVFDGFEAIEMSSDHVAVTLQALSEDSVGFLEPAPVQGAARLYRFVVKDGVDLSKTLESLQFSIVGGANIAESDLKSAHLSLDRYLRDRRNEIWIPDGFTALQSWNFRGDSDTRSRIVIVGYAKKGGRRYLFMLSSK